MTTGLPILTYHAIDDSGGVLSTSPAHFRVTLAALHAEGFRGVDLAEWVARGRPAVDRGFALAFDDGLRSIRLAADAIARFDVPATAFLVAGRMGRDNAWPGQPRGIPTLPTLAWSDLDGLRAAGFRFGAHTRTHPRLSACFLDVIEAEMSDGRAAIEAATGASCGLFAYPYGDAPAQAREVARRHFDAAFGTRLAYASSDDDVIDIARVDACYLRSTRGLSALISGALPAAFRWRRVARGARGMVAGVSRIGAAR